MTHCPLSAEVVSASLATLPSMSPSSNQTHLLCWRWSSGFRGNQRGGRVHPAPGESTAGRATLFLGFPTGAIFHRNSGLDRFRHTPLLPAWPALTHQECERSTPPLPSTPPRPSSSWIRHSQPSMPRGQVKNTAGSRQIAAYQRIGSRRAAPDQRIATGEGFRNLVASHSLSARVEDW